MFCNACDELGYFCLNFSHTSLSIEMPGLIFLPSSRLIITSCGHCLAIVDLACENASKIQDNKQNKGVHMLFSSNDRKIYISEKEYVDKTKGFNIHNIDPRDCAEFACRVDRHDNIYVGKNGQLMLGPYELHITS
jgi:hypothetical protein